MKSPRLFYLDPDLNKAVALFHCAICGKALKQSSKYTQVWSADFIHAVHPDDVGSINKENASGECMLIPVGNECVKKIPVEFVIKQ